MIPALELVMVPIASRRWALTRDSQRLMGHLSGYALALGGSAAITALSLTMLLRTMGWELAMLAAAAGVASKFVLRVRGRHIWNPAALAIVLVTSLLPGAWISTGQWGVGGWIAVFAAGELLREARRRRAEREHRDRVVGDGTGGDGTGGGEEDERTPSRLTRRLRAAGLQSPGWVFVIAVLLFAAGIGLGLWLALPAIPLAGMLAAILAMLVPFSVLDAVAHTRARRFLERFVDAIDVMCAALEGGEPPSNALASAAASAEEPARGEMREAHQRLQLGFSLRRSFSRMVERYDSEGVRLITQTMIVKWRTGGDLAPVLRSVNQIARERLRHERELRTHLAGAQASAILIAILPYLLVPFFLWKRPEWARELLGTPLGLQLLTVAILLQFVGLLWLRRLMRVRQ